MSCHDGSMEELPGDRYKSLKQAVLCVGWMKLLSIVCFIVLYVLVFANSKSTGTVTGILETMLLLAIPLQVLTGLLLFLGALEDKILALEVGLWFCLIMAVYNTVLGLIGAVYFIRTGTIAMHFVLAGVFALLALSLLTVICHDVLIVYSYQQMVLCCFGNPPGPCELRESFRC